MDVDLAAPAGKASSHLLRSFRQLLAQTEWIEVPDPVPHVRNVASLRCTADDGLDVQFEPILCRTSFPSVLLVDYYYYRRLSLEANDIYPTER